MSWVVPTLGVSEHPPDSIALGQEWVTRLVNAVMEGPEEQWLRTAIFITWDDWGGFYDHVKPIKIDENGYGIRVPGIMISPFAQSWLYRPPDPVVRRVPQVHRGSLPGRSAARPVDGRLARLAADGQRERPELGDIAHEFDFTQVPAPPLILDPTP